MSELIDAIRAQFPHPIRGTITNRVYTPDEYCVGGAICKFFDVMWLHGSTAEMFPDASGLAFALQHANPQLTDAQARISANAIIAANDSGRFDIAWRAAEHALTYTSERTQNARLSEVR